MFVHSNYQNVNFSLDVTSHCLHDGPAVTSLAGKFIAFAVLESLLRIRWFYFHSRTIFYLLFFIDILSKDIHSNVQTKSDNCTANIRGARGM